MKVKLIVKVHREVSFFYQNETVLRYKDLKMICQCLLHLSVQKIIGFQNFFLRSKSRKFSKSRKYFVLVDSKCRC